MDLIRSRNLWMKCLYKHCFLGSVSHMPQNSSHFFTFHPSSTSLQLYHHEGFHPPPTHLTKTTHHHDTPCMPPIPWSYFQVESFTLAYVFTLAHP